MVKSSILLFSLLLLPLSCINYIGHNLVVTDFQSQITAHTLLNTSGHASDNSSHLLSADCLYNGTIYIENSAFTYVQVEARLDVTLVNGSVLLAEDVFEENEDDGSSELPTMITASAEYEFSLTTTNAQNIMINLTCIKVGSWRVTIYENLPPDLMESYERAQNSFGITVVLMAINGIIALLGILHIRGEKGRRVMAPEEPPIKSRKAITSNHMSFNQLLKKLVYTQPLSQSPPNQGQTLSQMINNTYGPIDNFFRKVKQSGLKYELHPRNGFTPVIDKTVPEGSELREYDTLFRMAHDVNRAQLINPLWIVVIFLTGIYSMVNVFLLGSLVPFTESYQLYIFTAILAGLVAFLLMMACLFMSHQTDLDKVRSLLLLHPGMVRRLYEQSIYFPFADLRTNAPLNPEGGK